MRHKCVQRFTLYEFFYHVVEPVIFFDVINNWDARMIKILQKLCFQGKGCNQSGILRDTLDRPVYIQFDMFSKINGTGISGT